TQIDRTDVRVDEQHALPVLAAVVAAIDAARLARSRHVPHHGGVDDVRVLGMDADAADVARIGQPAELPRRARVDRLVDAVAGADVAAPGLLTAADVDDVGFALGHRDRA